MRPAICALLLAAATNADTLALHDGRFIDRDEVVVGDDEYRVRFENGEIVIPARLVKAYYKVGADGAWEPVTPEEKEKAARGLAPWDGRWVGKQLRERMLKKRAAEQKKVLEQMKARQQWRNHAFVKGRKWDFRHTLPDDIFSDLQSRFETYYDFYTKFWKIRKPAKFKKPTVHIYHKQEYFHQVSGAPAGVAGYYVPSTHELHFYFDRKHADFAIAVMYHEASHLLTHMINAKFRYPAWLSEGMAEFFGAAQLGPDGFKVGQVQSGRLAVLKSHIDDGKSMKLDTLLRSPRIDALGYAWAWSFVHYCMTTPRYSNGFKKYFRALAKSGHIKRARNVFGSTTVPANEAIRALKVHLKVKDLALLEADWHASVKYMMERAKYDYHQAGYIMMLWGEYKEARKFFKKAIDGGSTNAYDYYAYARMQYNRGKVGVAFKRCKEALGHDPLHARALSLLGLATFEKEDEVEGKRLIALARELAPDDNIIWYDQAILEERERIAKENEK